jgi:hypothetical protein
MAQPVPLWGGGVYVLVKHFADGKTALHVLRSYRKIGVRGIRHT